MLGEGQDPASARYRVGYDDALYINREYKSSLVSHPMRDVERLREGASNRASRGSQNSVIALLRAMLHGSRYVTHLIVV